VFLISHSKNKNVWLTCSVAIALRLPVLVQASAQKIAYYSVSEDLADIFVANANGMNPTNLTDDERNNQNPIGRRMDRKSSTSRHSMTLPKSSSSTPTAV
jgi:hypothetical protein